LLNSKMNNYYKHRAILSWLIPAGLCLALYPAVTYADTTARWIVNGDSTATEAVQGDSVILEFQLDEVGEQISFSLWLDFDTSYTITENDICMYNTLVSDDRGTLLFGLPNISPDFDSIIQLQFASFTLPACPILCQYWDSDLLSHTIPLLIEPIPEPIRVINGTVTLEGITPPDDRLKNILVCTPLLQIDFKFYHGAITDEYGNFTLGTFYHDTNFVLVPFTMIDKYIIPEPEYSYLSEDTVTMDFTYSLAQSYIYGDIIDEAGNPLTFPVIISLIDEENLKNRVLFTAEEQYCIGVSPGRYRILAMDFQMQVLGYMSSSHSKFNIFDGDSLRADLTCKRQTENIYCKVTNDGGAPPRSYYISAKSIHKEAAHLFGNIGDIFPIAVAPDSEEYSIKFNTAPVGMELPEGYAISINNERDANIGDTVNFEIVPAAGSVSGSVIIEPGAELNTSWSWFRLSVKDSVWEDVTEEPLDSNGTYRVYLLPGTYRVSLDSKDRHYFSTPDEYQDITVGTDEVEELDFVIHPINYRVQVNLHEADSDSIIEQSVHFKSGEWPDGMQLWLDIGPGDTIFTTGLPTGEWVVYAPNVSGHAAIIDSAVFILGPSDTFENIDFNYHEGVCAWVIGDVHDGDDEFLPDEIWVALTNLSTNETDSIMTESGHYEFAIIPGEYQLQTSYALLDHEPPYLMPPYWITDYFRFGLEYLDTIERPLWVYIADTAAYINVIENDGFPSRYYKFRATSGNMGLMIRHTDAYGDAVMPLSVGDYGEYSLSIALTDTPIPETLFIEGNENWSCLPGDSFFVNITPYEHEIWGNVTMASSFDELLPWKLSVFAQTDTLFISNTRVMKYGSYAKAIPPGVFSLWLEGLDTALIKPVMYDCITMEDADLFGYDFILNTKTCRVEARIENVPMDSIPETSAQNFGDGEYPDCYFVLADISEGDSVYSFLVCDGEWIFSPPVIPGYSANETTLVITEDDTLIHIAFTYEPSDIDNEAIKPTEWSVKAYPNPFNPNVQLEYSIAKDENIRIEIYDILGQKITILQDSFKPAGKYIVHWDGADDNGIILPSGIYFFRLKCKSFEKNIEIIHLQ